MLDAPARTRLSSADFWAFVNLPENQDRSFERVEGEIVEMSPANNWASEVIAELITLLTLYNRQTRLGRINDSSGGFDISATTTLAPDVAFTTFERIRQIYPDGKFPRTGFASLTPDLCVEVKSPTNSKRQMRQEAETYLKAGARLVWLIFPETETAEIYTPNADVAEIPREGILDGGDVLPGFSTPLTDIFPV